MSRGNGRMRIFLGDRDYRAFLNILGFMVASFDVECWDYCLMPNHYHLALYPRQRNISLAVQYLNGVYAMWWNAVHAHVGHVLQGRFKAQIVQHESYLLALCRYIARNPVRAGLVERPEQWPWSSYRAIANLCPNPGFLTEDMILSQFGAGDPGQNRARYVNCVQLVSPEAEEIEDRLRSKALVVGEPTFAAKLLSEQRGWRSSEPGQRRFAAETLEVLRPLV